MTQTNWPPANPGRFKPGTESDADDDAALPDFLSEDGGDEESDRSEDEDALTIAAE